MCNSSSNNSQSSIAGYQSQNQFEGRIVGTSSKTLAQNLDQRIASLQKQISDIERMKRQLAAGAALDADVSTLREALG